MNIPTGYNKADMLARKTMLVNELQKFNNQQYYCPALNKKVWVDIHSIDETAHNASKNFYSTIIALQLPNVIANAKWLVNKNNPRSNTQINTFHFKKIFILYSDMGNYGIAKLVIGKNKKGGYVEYSITELNIFTAH